MHSCNWVKPNDSNEAVLSHFIPRSTTENDVCFLEKEMEMQRPNRAQLSLDRLREVLLEPAD
jgi:hypothetical protein